MRPTIKVRVTKDRSAEVFKAIRGMEKRHVVVGVPESEDQREQDEDGNYLNPIGNAGLLYVHDNGSALANVPQREVVRPGIEDAKKDIAEVLGQGAGQVFTDPSAVERSLEAAGILASTAVKKRIIASIDLEPLADSTIAARQRDGIESEKPLIRTAQMLNAITHEVRDK